jgi:ribosomal protein L37AE/L43A
MFCEFTDGNCPECFLTDHTEEMRLNASDFWECPKCHLQAHGIMPGALTLIPLRGNAKQFKKLAIKDQVQGWMLFVGEPKSPYMPIQLISSEEKLKEFLKF